MFCSKCGSQLPDGAAFCGTCGEKVANRQPVQASTAVAQYNTPTYTVPGGGASSVVGVPNASSGIPKVAVLALAAVALLLVVVLAARGCGPAPSSLPDLSGHYEPADYFANFAIYEVDFKPDGTCVLGMDNDYAANYIKDGNTYRFEITGGGATNNPVTEVLNEHGAEQTKSAYTITATPNEDGSLTFKVKAKSGYIYFGDETCVFEKS